MEPQKDTNAAPSAVSCCGQEHTTPFCPSCGAKIRAKSEGIFGLLAHLRSTVESQEKSLATTRKRYADRGGPLTEKAANYLRRKEQQVRKWQSWENELRELLAGPDSTMALLMPCTVIEKGDLADRVLDRTKNP